MTVDLTTLEKYQQLSEVDKAEVALSTGGDAEHTLQIADRQLKLFEKIKFSIVWLVVIATLIFQAYFLGLPKSIIGFIGGVFAFLFMGAIWSALNYILVEAFFLIISKIFMEKLSHQKFRNSIEKKWTDLQSENKAINDIKRYEKERVEAEIAQEYQKDFDAILKYVSQGKTLLIPKSIIKFSADQLAEIAINRTISVIKAKNLSEEKKKESISYYRNISLFLSDIENDQIVELEETLIRINNLIQDVNVQDLVKSELLNEYLRISSIDLLKTSREERINKKYFEKFEEIFLSHNIN